MATVVIQKRKRKDRTSYLVTYRDPLSGKKKHYRTFQRMKEAQQAANDLRALLDAGKLNDIKKPRLCPMTFGEVANSLKQEWTERLQRRDLSQKTYDDYCIWLNAQSRTFGRKLLCEISSKEIEKYKNDLAAKHTNVTANRNLAIVRKVLKHGLALQAVFEDVSADISFLSEKMHERNRFLLPDELDRLLEAARSTKARYYMPVLIYLGAEHGAAKQEVLSLQWNDIDFQFQDRGIIKFFRTKNKRARTEYLMPRTKEALLEWREHQKWIRHRKKIMPVDSGLVICHLDGSPFKRFDSAWRATCRAAGIKNFHFHDLRHTFCSNLILSGADLKEIKEMIGHGEIAMTDRYSHLTSEHKLFRQERLAEHYQAVGKHFG